MHRLADINRHSWPDTHVVARSDGNDITWADFLADVNCLRDMFSARDTGAYALFEPDTYRFATALFALLAENRQVYLPGENYQAVADALTERGVRLAGSFGQAPALPVQCAPARSTVRDFQLLGSIVVFTSGSTGEPKAIPKSLAQIDAELRVLERRFGGELSDCTVLGTVSHQHLYGLLFQLLWPLASGRPFWHRPFVDPLLLASRALALPPSCWIMSPGHLHRLGQDIPWDALRGSVAAVFSSGGPLQWQAATQVMQGLGFCPTEILGSSETGGIASRQQKEENSPWEALPGVDVSIRGDNSTLAVRSPFLVDTQWYTTQDRATLRSDGRFTLQGRADRIVKLEGKRISLPEVEQALSATGWIEQSHAQTVQRQRLVVGALVSVSAEGASALQGMGLTAFTRQLRGQLTGSLPALAIPRIFRLCARLPRNSQGKLQPEIVEARLATTTAPAELSLEERERGCELLLWVDRNCPYFEGHFPQGPVLPGVAQIKWAQDLAAHYLGITGHFSGMQTIKFKEIVQPNATVRLELSYDNARECLQFRYTSASGEHSQGRLLYKTNA